MYLLYVQNQHSIVSVIQPLVFPETEFKAPPDFYVLPGGKVLTCDSIDEVYYWT